MCSRIELPDPSFDGLVKRVCWLFEELLEREQINHSASEEVKALLNKIIELESERNALVVRSNATERQLLELQDTVAKL